MTRLSPSPLELTAVQAVRLRLSRAKGFDLQAHSLATNGLPAVVVARPTKWGNPFAIGEEYPVAEGDIGGEVIGTARIADARDAVEAFTAWATDEGTPLSDVTALRGRNLACWCAIIDRHGKYVPCHADVLLRLANPVCEALPTPSTDVRGGAR